MLEWLKTILGEAYSDEIDKKVSAEIGKAFVSKTDFNAANEAKKTLDAQIAERDKQLDELKKVDAAGLQAEITRLQEENKTVAAKHAAELAQIKLDTAVETELLKAKAVNTKAVKALLDMSKVEVDGDTVKGLADQLKALQESEAWAFGAGPSKTGMEHGSDIGSTDEVSAAFYKRNPELKPETTGG